MTRLLWICIFLAFACKGLGVVNEDHDPQLWQYDVLWVKLNNKDRLRLAQEFRWGDSMSKCYFFYHELQYHHAFCKNWEGALGYRQIWSSIFTGGGTFKPIYVPMVDTTFTFTFKKWKLVNRNRGEYAMLHHAKNFWILRTRGRLFFPITFSCYNITPFIDEELFFLQRRGFAQNRVSIGGKLGFSKHVAAHFFFMFRHIKIAEKWRVHNVLGNRLIFTF